MYKEAGRCDLQPGEKSVSRESGMTGPQCFFDSSLSVGIKYKRKIQTILQNYKMVSTCNPATQQAEAGR
jgi:hypothetical protein